MFPIVMLNKLIVQRILLHAFHLTLTFVIIIYTLHFPWVTGVPTRLGLLVHIQRWVVRGCLALGHTFGSVSLGVFVGWFVHGLFSLKVGVLGQVHALHLVVDVPHVVVHCIDGVVIGVLHVVVE